MQSGAATGAKIYLDDAFMGPTTGGAGGFRNEVVTTLKTLNPGTLRYMYPPGLSQTDAYFEGNDYQKGPPNDYSVGANIMWIYSLKDMYALAGAIGANPWVSIPDVFNDTDVTSFAANLCSAFAANGFSKAFVEQSNEDWVTDLAFGRRQPYLAIRRDGQSQLRTDQQLHDRQLPVIRG